ncbi:hypothetical protein IU433_01830 [Nocardia puris]|uniref:Uncharacterized protein n=1 Tax=Nocardia puris TaxID=208602 RepID=A0A366DV37_9NOCA|nr:hypothetical protein [Nocardia puris]MBF6210526.1 hypothetical protein [Nocardia puris]MBF6369251.1 hypothetical protein [Nocardia puris]MBF6457786.1 hypothetical protein [Nocardia puris]RBO93953.1 hypothetical protein DFR74_102373 [Nocardia puris]
MFGLHTHDRARPPAASTTTVAPAMVVFGTGTDCYLSHLPSFEPPSDVQAIVSVDLDERGRGALGADLRVGYLGNHTFVGDGFVPADLDPASERPVTELRGTLFRGDPRRGCPMIATGVLATVRSVVFAARLEPFGLAGRPTHLCFGRPGHWYLAHRIGRRPSFDQIAAVRRVPGGVTDLLGEPRSDEVFAGGFAVAQPVILGQREFHGQRLRTGEVVVAAFRADADGQRGLLAEFEVERQIHLEVGDLS